MVRPDRDEHAWERLCARKRDEIERDTRLLSAQQAERCERAERLYAELESAHAHTEDKDEECFVRKKDGGPVGGIPREKKRWIKQGQKRPQKRP